MIIVFEIDVIHFEFVPECNDLVVANNERELYGRDEIQQHTV